MKRDKTRSKFMSSVLGLLVLLVALLSSTTLLSDSADATFVQDLDEDVPPGNPVIGSDRPGDIEPENDTNYALWGLVAVCLITAGVLLVRIERWEARRSQED